MAQLVSITPLKSNQNAKSRKSWEENLVMNFKPRDPGRVPDRKGGSEDTQVKTSAGTLMDNSRMSLAPGRAA